METPFQTVTGPADLGRPQLRLPPFSHRSPIHLGAIAPGSTRPGLALRTVGARDWLRQTFGLPERRPGAPLEAYASGATRVWVFAAVLTWLALALLPSLVAGARAASGAASTMAGPWAWWRVVTAPFWLAGVCVLPLLVLAAGDAVPWWMLTLPVARWIALTATVGAIAVMLGYRGHSARPVLLGGPILGLAASLAMAPAAALLTRWFTGWAGALPDPEVPIWIQTWVRSGVWLLIGMLAVTAVLAVTAWRHPARERPEARPTGRPEDSRRAAFRRRAAVVGRIAAGSALAGVVLVGTRIALHLSQGDKSAADMEWTEPVSQRQAGPSTSSPAGMRSAFRAFGAGDYQSVEGGLRRLASDALTVDDRLLLQAATALAAGDSDAAREATGQVQSQYSAALIARAAAEARSGAWERPAPPVPEMWSSLPARSGEHGARPDEAADLERLIQSLDAAHYLIYSPRRSSFLRVPYALFPRPGQVALRITMLRRLVALRPRDDTARVELAQTLQEHERLLTDASVGEVQAAARLGLGRQREQLCHEALELNPRNWQALVVLGRLDEAIALRPRDPELRQKRIARAHETGDNTHLIEDARQLLQQTPSDAARYTLAMAHVCTGALPAGLEELRRLLERAAGTGPDPASHTAEFARWSMNAAILLARLGQLDSARTLMERVRERDALDDKAPIEPRTVLALLRLEAGDRAGARELIDHRPPDRPLGSMLPVIAELTLRDHITPRALRRVNLPTGPVGFSPRSLAWKDEGCALDLEPIARAILRRDRHSMAARYLLADALATRVQPRPVQEPPDAQILEVLQLLHGLTREFPGWIPPLECLSSLCMRLGHFERASGYQRVVGDLYGDMDRGRWLWRSPFSGPRPGLPGYNR
jgi:hypothetical protein